MGLLVEGGGAIRRAGKMARMPYRIRVLCKTIGELLLTERGEHVFMLSLTCMACVIAWSVLCSASLRKRQVTIAQLLALIGSIAYGLFLGNVLAAG